MLEALLLGMLFLFPQAPAGQTPAILRIKVVVLDAERKATPVARHALLVSDNPSSAAPRRIVTTVDGTATMRLPPGNYTVESDEPVAFLGKAYRWTQTLDVLAGRETVLELTADNAEVEPLTPAAEGAAPVLDTDPSFLLGKWEGSVVAVWTPSTRASGFVIDPRGLIATTQRIVGTATSVEVQLAPAVKVLARVIVADAERDVAVLRVNPATITAITPVPLGCEKPAAVPVVDREEIFTIGAPSRARMRVASGTVRRVEPQSFVSDLILPAGSAGGPVFAADGRVIGITTLVDETQTSYPRIVRIAAACTTVASAEKQMQEAAPSATLLPVEPAKPFPVDALKQAVQGRAGSLNPYQIASSDFDIAFITPVLVYGAQQASSAARDRRSAPAQAHVPALMDFGEWSSYMSDFPPVLLVRVTPKLAEGFWTKVGRVAASTQGVSLPEMKRFKSGFARMRAMCGDAEVTPIHPFTIERPVSDTDSIYEGLYVFDPGAIGPHCGTVTLELYSEKAPTKKDLRTVDPKVLQQVWQDFALYRAQAQ